MIDNVTKNVTDMGEARGTSSLHLGNTWLNVVENSKDIPRNPSRLGCSKYDFKHLNY